MSAKWFPFSLRSASRFQGCRTRDTKRIYGWIRQASLATWVNHEIHWRWSARSYGRTGFGLQVHTQSTSLGTLLGDWVPWQRRPCWRWQFWCRCLCPRLWRRFAASCSDSTSRWLYGWRSKYPWLMDSWCWFKMKFLWFVDIGFSRRFKGDKSYRVIGVGALKTANGGNIVKLSLCWPVAIVSPLKRCNILRELIAMISLVKSSKSHSTADFPQNCVEHGRATFSVTWFWKLQVLSLGLGSKSRAKRTA